MAYAADLKSAARKGLGVRIPSPVPLLLTAVRVCRDSRGSCATGTQIAGATTRNTALLDTDPFHLLNLPDCCSRGWPVVAGPW